MKKTTHINWCFDEHETKRIDKITEAREANGEGFRGTEEFIWEMGLKWCEEHYGIVNSDD